MLLLCAAAFGGGALAGDVHDASIAGDGFQRFGQAFGFWDDAAGQSCGLTFASSLSSEFSLPRSVPNRVDDHPIPPDTVKNDIGSASDDELADSWLCADPTEVGMMAQGFHHCNDAHGQSLCCLGFVQCDVCANFLEPKPRQGRPDDFDLFAPPRS